MKQRNCWDVASELSIRLVLFAFLVYSESLNPFERVIHPEEWWLYKNPSVDKPAFSTLNLYIIVTLAPLLTIILFSGLLHRSQHDFFPAILCSTLLLLMNGCVTNCIKLGVGRPRPDFFYRCYPLGNPPDGQPSTSNLKCNGNVDLIIEGRKSFPSGHSSFAFSALGFCSLYLCGKLQCFNSVGRGKSWRLTISLLPLLAATMIAISRTSDYRHHWQDVLVGSLLGFSINFLVYRQYYPSLFSDHCAEPYLKQAAVEEELRFVTSGNKQMPNIKHM